MVRFVTASLLTLAALALILSAGEPDQQAQADPQAESTDAIVLVAD